MEPTHTAMLVSLGAMLLASAAVVAAAPAGDTSAGWVKSPHSPVLGGKLGTCFDVSVLRDGGEYRMWFSWRPRRSIALVESADGVKWGRPQIVLGPNPKTGWEQQVNRPAVVKRSDGYHMWYTGQVGGSKGTSAIGHAISEDGKACSTSASATCTTLRSGWPGRATG